MNKKWNKIKKRFFDDFWDFLLRFSLIFCHNCPKPFTKQQEGKKESTTRIGLVMEYLREKRQKFTGCEGRNGEDLLNQENKPKRKTKNKNWKKKEKRKKMWKFSFFNSTAISSFFSSIFIQNGWKCQNY